MDAHGDASGPPRTVQTGWDGPPPSVRGGRWAALGCSSQRKEGWGGSGKGPLGIPSHIMRFVVEKKRIHSKNTCIKKSMSPKIKLHYRESHWHWAFRLMSGCCVIGRLQCNKQLVHACTLWYCGVFPPQDLAKPNVDGFCFHTATCPAIEDDMTELGGPPRSSSRSQTVVCGSKFWSVVIS